MRVDTHVHTFHSGNTTLYPLKYLLRESYNSPEGVYRRAKARGMDLVRHHRPRSASPARSPSRIGPDVPGRLRGDGGVPRGRRARASRRARDQRGPAPRDADACAATSASCCSTTHREELFVSLNHVASRINGDVTAAHIAAHHAVDQRHRSAQRFAAAGAEPHRDRRSPRRAAR